ncbi:RimJ/RimL family protein N-acetyltransferase [Lentzea atacamensis]|uniref:RimJ/RimL family protein N-acetyltransferase n=1 Tax=Lentzea atacamensis TaxID=531938 RepID=A0A316I3Y7_9PSEU|nr:GNAT family protein [Lentzea atacamensis]PWK88106.1 RimJ/RimL family protein N-acetyltransferase [Lentzea atacamensis]
MYSRFVAGEAEALADFLAGEPWPFHVHERVDRADVLQRVAENHYDETYWIEADGERAGIVRLFDLEDETPMFDLRISARHRGKGLGRAAVRWLTDRLFGEFPHVERIEGTTRQDNAAMRRVFRRCGYVKEAHYRRAWPDASGHRHDSVGYAIIRRDWQTGETTVPDFHDE